MAVTVSGVFLVADHATAGETDRADPARATCRARSREAPMGHALVLNATYEPLCVVPARRALLLVLMRKAISVEDSDLVLHSASIQVRAPAVVRLTRYVRIPYRGPVPLTRRAVFARDGGRCVYCGVAGDEHRPRRAAQPRRPARVGQRRVGLPPLQPREGRPDGGRPRLAAAPAAGADRHRLADPRHRPVGPELGALPRGLRRRVGGRGRLGLGPLP